MASYLFPYQPVTYEPYESPIELYGAALQYKNVRFAQGLANIRSHYDAVLNTPLTNEADQLAVRAGINTAMQRLSKSSVSDLSLPENQAEINSVFDSILDDQDIMYDAAWTRRHNREIRKAEDLAKTKPELVPPQNLEPLYLAQEDFRKAPKGARPRPTQFTPYYDFDTKMRDVLEKTKADVDVMFSHETTQVEGPDGKMHNVAFDGQYTVEQLKGYTINKIVNQRLGSDPQAMHQMGLDYNYNTRNGFYPASNAIAEIDEELAAYKSMDQAIQTALDAGKNFENQDLTPNQKAIYEENKKGVAAATQRLSDLKSRIKINPAAANEYFTFSKHVQKYVSSLQEQFAYHKQSLISDIPQVAALQKHRYDVWLRQWDHMYDVDLEGVKSANKAREEAAKAKTEITSVQAPLIDLTTMLDSSPTGSIPIDNETAAGLADMTMDSDKNLWKTWTGTGKTPETTLIAVPGSESFTREQLAAVNQNTIFKKMEQELDGLGVKIKKRQWTGYADTGGGGGSMATGMFDATADELLSIYKDSPDKLDPKAKSVIEKYKPLLGVDPTDKDQVRKLKDQLSDISVNDSVNYGLTLQMNGKFKIVPDNGNNLIAGDKGLMYMKAHAIVPKSKARDALGDKGLANGVRNQYVLDWDPIVTTTEDGKKQTEDGTAISVYIPIYGDPASINDRLLKTKGYQDQWGQKAPGFRQESEKQVRTFFEEVVPAAQAFPSGQGVITPRSGGGYQLAAPRMTAHGPVYDRAYEQVVGVAAALSSRTGIPYNEALDGAVQAIGAGQTGLQRLKLLQQFESTVGQQAPDMNSRAARNNNPLNIKDDSAGGIFATGKDDQNHAIFATPMQGLQAGLGKLQNILAGNSSKYSANSTIWDFSKTYAESPYDTKNLVNALKNLGFNATEDTRISQIPVAIFLEAMIMKEDRKYYNYLKNSGILDAFLKQI